jgi:hypothetical protein
MSPREQKLLILFATAGFLMVNFLAIGFYKTKRAEVESKYDEAKRNLDTAELFRASREQVMGDMEWLAKHEPEPAANQDVQVKLQELCKKEADAAGLTVKTQKLLPSDSTEGNYFHRAKIQIVVTGTEQALYRWFDRLNVPDQLRGATRILVSPNKEDDSKIDCTATIEQWFVPIPPSA